MISKTKTTVIAYASLVIAKYNTANIPSTNEIFVIWREINHNCRE